MISVKRSRSRGRPPLAPKRCLAEAPPHTYKSAPSRCLRPTTGLEVFCTAHLRMFRENKVKIWNG